MALVAGQIWFVRGHSTYMGGAGGIIGFVLDVGLVWGYVDRSLMV